jgi:hypothetical protein
LSLILFHVNFALEYVILKVRENQRRLGIILNLELIYADDYVNLFGEMRKETVHKFSNAAFKKMN